MRSDDHEIRVVPSVLDRLFDRDPTSTRDVLPTRARSTREFRAQVRRDVEQLLNARNSFFDKVAEFPQMAGSVLAYGLPDISSRYLTLPRDRQEMRVAIERAIATFEPRLRNVRVSESVSESPVLSTDGRPDSSGRKVVMSVHFRVDAELVIDPNAEPIGFDIDVAVGARQYAVKERA